MKIRKTIGHSGLVGKLRGEPTNDWHSHPRGICMALKVFGPFRKLNAAIQTCQDQNDLFGI